MSQKSVILLREMARRIQHGFVMADPKPLFLHWSDGSLLLDVANQIYELERKNERLKLALEGALIMIASKENK